MIIVLSDDLSGAVEMAGIAWRYGLDAEISLGTVTGTTKELVVVDTNTRSLEADKAEQIMRKVLSEIEHTEFEWLYKKTDSVLRGHVVLELVLCLEYLKTDQILLVPQNPGLGRTIRNGCYYINDLPLADTGFAKDPEYPRESSDVTQLLKGSHHIDIHFLTQSKPADVPGIFVGEADNSEDMHRLASFLTDQMLAAGGSEFFAALLGQKGYQIRSQNEYYQPGQRRLFISGTATEQGRNNRIALEKADFIMCPSPDDLALNDRAGEIWCETILAAFGRSQKIAAYLSDQVIADPLIARDLIQRMTQCIANVLNVVQVDELIIEGGATASTLVRRMSWDHLMPVIEFETGSVSLTFGADQPIQLIIKPGSYPMPQHIIATKH